MRDERPLHCCQVLNWHCAGGLAECRHRAPARRACAGLYSRAWKLPTIWSPPPRQRRFRACSCRLRADAERCAEGTPCARAILRTGRSTRRDLSTLTVVRARHWWRSRMGSQWAESIPLIQILFAVLVPRCCYKISVSVMIGFEAFAIGGDPTGFYATLMIGVRSSPRPSVRPGLRSTHPSQSRSSIWPRFIFSTRLTRHPRTHGDRSCTPGPGACRGPRGGRSRRLPRNFPPTRSGSASLPVAALPWGFSSARCSHRR